MDFSSAVDWVSIKLLGTGIALLMISGGAFIMWLSGLAFFSTLLYNGIKIYKELKNKKKE